MRRSTAFALRHMLTSSMTGSAFADFHTRKPAPSPRHDGGGSSPYLMLPHAYLVLTLRFHRQEAAGAS